MPRLKTTGEPVLTAPASTRSAYSAGPVTLSARKTEPLANVLAEPTLTGAGCRTAISTG